jgi:transcriptional regulator with XRE-family HTH domain
MIDFRPMIHHPLKIWRLAHTPPLSQRKLGLKLGVTDMAVSRWERWQFPDFDALARLYKLTGLTPNHFFKPLRISPRAKPER